MGTAFVLLADHRLLAIRAQDGTVLATPRLAPPPTTTSITGHGASTRALALSRDGAHLFVIVPSSRVD